MVNWKVRRAEQLRKDFRALQKLESVPKELAGVMGDVSRASYLKWSYQDRLRWNRAQLCFIEHHMLTILSLGLVPQVTYYSRVGLELGKLVVQQRAMAPP